LHYYEKYDYLKEIFTQDKDFLSIPGYKINIHNYNFVSPGTDVLPGKAEYFCDKHSASFDEFNSESLPGQAYENNHNKLFFQDCNISENNDFVYSVLKPEGSGKLSDAVFLFHGFNEKEWCKYLLWATEIVSRTGKAVVLFPLAFHMNRTKNVWSDKHLMQKISAERTRINPLNKNSSYLNAAISTRIESNPQRFFWSGLQTYYDTIGIFKEIKTGRHPDFKSDCNINILAYSIGCFFSLLMLMADPDKLFCKTKLFCFCGGATFERMNPDSRYILDKSATVALQTYFAEQLESDFKSEKRLSHYLSDNHYEESCFKTMLNYHRYRELREKRLLEIHDRIRAIALEKDYVIPPKEVINTLQGIDRNIPVNVCTLDYGYPYSHVTMFNQQIKYASEVDNCFNEFIDEIINFL